ncbi:MAG: hypothetical protein KGI69_03960 [Patescibacteria group bacterium]|nr:hypothetical protein [Patescibacteria group bacterium]
MLYAYHGSDIASSLKKARALIDSLRAKRPDATFIEVTADRWSPSAIEENIGGQGLFSSKYVVFLNRVTENADADERLPGFMEVMGESDNIFILLEGKLGASLKKEVEAHADKAVETEARSGARAFGSEEPNAFALADAVGSRDAAKAWALYRQAIDAGIGSENIIGTLFWQAKSMAVAARAKSAAEAGLSPFVYSKAKRFASRYSQEELGRLLSELVSIYHDSHRGARDAELSLEAALLKL